MRGAIRGDLVASGLLDIALLTVPAPWPLGTHCILVDLAYCLQDPGPATLPSTAGCWAPVLFFSV